MMFLGNKYLLSGGLYYLFKRIHSFIQVSYYTGVCVYLIPIEIVNNQITEEQSYTLEYPDMGI